MRLTWLSGALVALVVGGGAVVGPAGPAAAVEEECSSVQAGTPRTSQAAASPSLPLETMRVPEVHALLAERGVRPGQGVRVAVIDSGVATTPEIPVVERVTATGRTDLLDWHGTAVAGLIAGRPRPDGRLVGIAPAAEIVDVRVYDTPQPADASEAGVSASGVLAGLRWVLERGGIDIVNVSLRVRSDPQIERAVRQLWRRGTIVVAAAGNRPQEGDPDADELEEFVEPSPGQDAAGVVFPAGYEKVLAVSATTDGLPEEPGDASRYVLPNSRTDVAAPVAGGISIGLNGGPCLLLDVATSWAAAEVSGTLAMLKSAHPRETPTQLVARLVATAAGHAGVRSPLTGAGVVQPLEALLQPVNADRDGRLQTTEVARDERRVAAPEPAPDAYAEPRRAATWWGLLGAGALVLAAVLRPVLARRTR